MWRRIRISTAGIVPPGRVARYAYRWGGAAVAGLGLIQTLVVPPRNSAALAYLAAVAVGVGIWFLPARTVRATWGVAIAVAAMAFAVGTPVLVTVLGAMAATFALSRYVESREAWSGYVAIVIAVASVAIPQSSPGQGDTFGLAYPLVYVGGAWLLGWLSRQYANHVRTMRQCAAALERDDAQHVALDAASERVRIARELHEAISNRVGLMLVQVEAAREALTREPEQAVVALDGVGLAGRQAINDLRQMVGVLRDPRASLDISDLMEPARAAGLTVDLVQHGDDQWIKYRVRSAVYRIVQESLTSTLRHSTATHIRVAIRYGVTSVDLEILDNGPVTKPEVTAESEHELTGIRNQALEVNGEVTMGARSDGPGFRVWASLPTGGVGVGVGLATWPG